MNQNRSKRRGIRTLTLRIDAQQLDQLFQVADYEGRSLNSQVNILIRDCIHAYADRLDNKNE